MSPKPNKTAKSSKKGFKAAVGTVRKTSKIITRVAYTIISVSILVFGILFAVLGRQVFENAVIIGVVDIVVGLILTVVNIKKFKDIK